jgi:glyoxylase-like metal-dependent hydrolase (beta-lactamase superfamily II)
MRPLYCDFGGQRDSFSCSLVSRRGHLLENFGMPHDVFADGEKQSLGALIRERLEDRRVLPGHGPSSKVSTTSCSRRKS